MGVIYQVMSYLNQYFAGRLLMYSIGAILSVTIGLVTLIGWCFMMGSIITFIMKKILGYCDEDMAETLTFFIGCISYALVLFFSFYGYVFVSPSRIPYNVPEIKMERMIDSEQIIPAERLGEEVSYHHE